MYWNGKIDSLWGRCKMNTDSHFFSKVQLKFSRFVDHPSPVLVLFYRRLEEFNFFFYYYSPCCRFFAVALYRDELRKIEFPRAFPSLICPRRPRVLKRD